MSVTCFLHRTFAINSSFFPPLSLHIAAPNPQAGFLFYYSATPIFSSSFGSVVNAVLFCFKPPSPHLLHIAPHLTHTLHPFAWLTNLRSPSAERRRHSLVTRKEIENDNDTLSSVLPRVPVHYETSLADHHVPRGQPAKQPADTGDHSLTHCCFV